MNFNPDLRKQAQELLFSQKTSSNPYPSLNFNDNPVHQVPLQKHLGLFLDPKLSFDEHIQCILIKTRKIIGLIRKLQAIIPRSGQPCEQLISPSLDLTLIMEMLFMIAHLTNLSKIS